MKKYMIAGMVSILISVILATFSEYNQMLSFLKCLTLAFGITILSYGFLQPHMKYKSTILYGIGVMLFVLYVIIAFDTYIVHTLPIIPGIIRYPIFSLYGVGYLVFCLIGILLSFKKTN